jgi:hypothetical protein
VSDITPENIFNLWSFQDTFIAESLKILSEGAMMGALTLVKHITLAQIQNGNRMLNNDEMMKLVAVATEEVIRNTSRSVTQLRNPDTTQ